MNQKFNYVFCKYKNDFDYCYNKCDRECPSVSNLWYSDIRNPIVNFFIAIRHRFIKCNQMPTHCSYLYREKYCLLKDRNCYSNRNKEAIKNE